MDILQTYKEWLSESFLLDEIERTPDSQERFEKLYDYLMALNDYEDYTEEEEETKE